MQNRIKLAWFCCLLKIQASIMRQKKKKVNLEFTNLG